ncbi:hypothetical protein F0U60_32735 [Archangium minus]|uniref:Band 7 domain-containing protein n=1 Tax=Archangium minus TaxID=83450 RepID=A0ABY9WZ17_9BACT|nr:hypothetical protein F0U60_32735 [Archangium minus]
MSVGGHPEVLRCPGAVTGTRQLQSLSKPSERHWLVRCVGFKASVTRNSQQRVLASERGVEIARARASDWDKSLQALATHAALSILGNRDFEQILCDRSELGELVRQDIKAETERWGLEVERVLIRNVSLLSEVAQQVFDTLAAQLERAKAEEEEGRQRVALLEAQTSAQVASLVAEAKGQYPAAVGRAFAALGNNPRVLSAYNELYALSQVRPHRTVAFHGFERNELRAMDAAMLVPVGQEAPAPRNSLDERGKAEA